MLGVLGVPQPTAAQPPEGPRDWMTAYNYLRSQGGLDPVVEHPTLSDHGLLNARYIDANSDTGHGQDPTKPHYTEDGNRSSVESVHQGIGGPASQVQAINDWQLSSAHWTAMMNPQLALTGMGYVYNPQVGTSIAVNTDAGIDPSRDDTMWVFPSDGALMPYPRRVGSCPPDHRRVTLLLPLPGTDPRPDVTARVPGGALYSAPDDGPFAEPTADGSAGITAHARWGAYTCVDEAVGEVEWEYDSPEGRARITVTYRDGDDIPGYPVAVEPTTELFYPVRPDGYQSPCPHPDEGPCDALEPAPGTDLPPDAPPADPGPTGPDPAGPVAIAPGLERLANSPDPVIASIEISTATFDPASTTDIVIGRNDLFPDNLGGSAFAGLLGGPLLLNPTSRLDDRVATEIQRLADPGRDDVWLLGGEGALSTQVVADLRALGFTPRRLAGASRVETSVAIAEEMLARSDGTIEVYIARDNNFADSATGGALAAREGKAILVNPQQSLHPAVRAFLTDHNLTAAAFAQIDGCPATILGGAAAISSEVESGLEALLGCDVVRLAGDSRDATAVEIADRFGQVVTRRVTTVTLVNGYRDDGWVFGLSGGAAAPRTNSPLVYVHDVGGVSAVTAAYLRRVAPDSVIALGPASSIPDDVAMSARGSADAGGGNPEPTPSDTSCDVVTADGPLAAGDRMEDGERLADGTVLSADAGPSVTIAQGELRVFDGGGSEVYATATGGQVVGAVLCEGDLILYHAGGPFLHTDTGGHPDAYAVIQDDTNMVIYDAEDRFQWGTIQDDPFVAL